MEGILAILIVAASLPLLLRKKPPPPKVQTSSYSFWDTWAFASGYFFYPYKKNIPMTIVLNKGGYAVYVYAQRAENLANGRFKDETEVNIQLKYNIADGLSIQNRMGRSGTRKNQNATVLQFNKNKLDDNLHFEASDTRTAIQMLEHPNFISICDRFSQEVETSRIEHRTLILRQPSHQIDKLPKLITRAIQYCQLIDQETLSIWENLANQLNLYVRKESPNGYPSLEGVKGQFFVRVQVFNLREITTELIVDLPEYFPKELLLLGSKINIKSSKYKERRFEQIATTKCLYSINGSKSILAFISNPKALTSFARLFKLYPKSRLENRKLILVLPHRVSSSEEVEGRLKKLISLAERLDTYCAPSNEPDFD